MSAGGREGGVRAEQSGTFLLAQLCMLAHLNFTGSNDFIRVSVSEFHKRNENIQSALDAEIIQGAGVYPLESTGHVSVTNLCSWVRSLPTGAIIQAQLLGWVWGQI